MKDKRNLHRLSFCHPFPATSTKSAVSESLAHQVMLKEKIPLVLREPFFRQLKEFVEDKLDEWEDEQFSTESQEHHQQTPEKDDHSTDKFSRFSSVLKAVNLEKRQNQSSASSGSFWEQYHRVISLGILD